MIHLALKKSYFSLHENKYLSSISSLILQFSNLLKYLRAISSLSAQLPKWDFSLISIQSISTIIPHPCCCSLDLTFQPRVFSCHSLWGNHSPETYSIISTSSISIHLLKFHLSPYSCVSLPIAFSLSFLFNSASNSLLSASAWKSRRISWDQTKMAFNRKTKITMNYAFFRIRHVQWNALWKYVQLQLLLSWS